MMILWQWRWHKTCHTSSISIPPPRYHQISTHGKTDHLVTMVTGIECPSRVHILLHSHTRIHPVLGKETKSSWIYYQMYCERQTCCKRLHRCFCLHDGAQLFGFFFNRKSFCETFSHNRDFVRSFKPWKWGLLRETGGCFPDYTYISGCSVSHGYLEVKVSPPLHPPPQHS